MNGFSVRHVTAVLPHGVVEDATIVVEDGVIASIAERGPAPSGALDGRGRLCLPGFVDTHSDGLEKELQPRPGVRFPMDFAVRSFEGRVRAAGITTMFHGVGFEDDHDYGRTVVLANEFCDALESLAASGHALVDHRILYRLDARDPAGLAALVRRLSDRRPDGALPLVSFEDHTPGQGQYADRAAFERYLSGTKKMTPDAARERVDALIAERAEFWTYRQRAIPWLTHAAAGGEIRLMAHDPASAADVAEAAGWAAAIAEFPTTVEAARAARDHGLRTVCGAPNVLRGGSHSGNVAAEELIALGLCDGLASDYLPSTLLGAVAALVHRGTCSLPAALALVTSGPADTVGLPDRGRLVVGARGDLVLARLDGPLPAISSVLRADEHAATPVCTTGGSCRVSPHQHDCHTV